MRARVLAMSGLVACGSSAATSVEVPVEAGAPALTAAPTWYRDVEPIVQTECVGCHVAQGTGGFLLDRETAVLLASFISEQVAARTGHAATSAKLDQ